MSPTTRVRRSRVYTIRLSDLEYKALEEIAMVLEAPRSDGIHCLLALWRMDTMFGRWMRFFIRNMRPGAEDSLFESWEEYLKNGGEDGGDGK